MSDQIKNEKSNESDPKLDRLKAWTEKPFPIELRENFKAPFLHQFTGVQLREGLIYATTAYKALEAEFMELYNIYEANYTAEKHKQTFKSVVEAFEKDRRTEYDEAVMIDDNVMEADDHATAIREWENLTGFDDERMLRYTLCVTSRTDDKLRGHIKELRNSITVARKSS